jgi:hypothetical protein
MRNNFMAKGKTRKLQKLLLIDGVLSIRARDLTAYSLSRSRLESSKGGKKVLSMEMCKIHSKLSVIEFR